MLLFVSFCNLELLALQLDVSSSQLLVTDSDFENPKFREQLTETVESLLDLKVIPIFNENDAISTRKAPYEVCKCVSYHTSPGKV
jgi:delta-1-pyrroline-5-carboxylate synthetase